MAEISPSTPANNPNESEPDITPIPDNQVDSIIKDDKSKSEPQKDEQTESKSNKWKRAEIISFISILFTAALFYMNIKSFEKTTQAVAISDSTYRHNRIKDSLVDIGKKHSDSIATIKERRIDSLDSIVRLRDYIKDSNNYALSIKSLNAQITSIQETKKQFEEENRPFIQISDIKTDTSGYRGLLSFKIINYGKLPANVLYIKYRIGMALSVDENKIIYLKWQTNEHNIYVASGINYLPEFTTMKASSNQPMKAIKNGEIIMYLDVEIKYTTYGTKRAFLHTSINKIKYGVSNYSIRNDDVEIR